MHENPPGANRSSGSSFANPEEIEDPDISVVIPYRHSEAYDNFLDFTLHCFKDQSLPRSRFTIILTEQDIKPRAPIRVAHHVDRYVFGWSDRPFNRAWGLNMGFADNSATYYCCFDVDFVVDREFLERQLARMQKGINVLRPYRRIRNLDSDETQNVLADPSLLSTLPVSPSLPAKSVGGILIFRADFYRRLGGYVEDFEGWGYEDTLMARWVKKLGEWSEGDETVYHMWHPPSGNKKTALPNKAIFESYNDWSAEQIYARAAGASWGSTERYRVMDPGSKEEPDSSQG